MTRTRSIVRLTLLACILSMPTLVHASPETTSPATQPALASPVERANADAVARLYAQLAAASAGDGNTVGDVIDAVEGKQRIIAGLSSRAQQIGGPRELGDGIVQVSLEMSGAKASELLVEAINAKPERCPVSPEQLAKELQTWSSRTFASTGDNAADLRVAVESGKMPTTAPLVWPAQPPKWVNDPVTASAVATKNGPPLRTARFAESSARSALRDEIAKLVVIEERSLADVASDHAEVQRAIDAAVETARIAGVDYRADGSVEVRIWIDGRQLWQLLQLAR